MRLLKSCDREPPCRIGHCTVCDDPELPALPDPRADWPRASITILSLSEIEATGRDDAGSKGGAGKADASAESLEDVFASLEAAAGRRVRIEGQFRGRNLFGDLPEASQRGALACGSYTTGERLVMRSSRRCSRN